MRRAVVTVTLSLLASIAGAQSNVEFDLSTAGAPAA